ncbi:hypothetical protein AGMMS50293_26270 [Spirochaetia bacterium]|nr:hypothetical protein AGMMS50293_26270 [Spirochaetia bacterium]
MDNSQKAEKKIRMNETRPVEYSLTPPYPRNMMLGLTNTCNHRCIFCCYRNNPPKAVNMSKEKAFDIIKQGYELGVRELGFCLISEPFMSEHLEDCVGYAKSLGYEYVYFTTNGSLASKDRMERLWTNGLDSIKFSVNAATRETYKKVHGRDDFDRVIQNIIAADELRKKNTLPHDASIFVSFIETIANKNEAELLHTMLGNVIDNFYTIPAINMNGKLYEEMEQGIVLHKSAVKDYTDVITSTYIDQVDRHLCYKIFNRFSVTAEGYYTVCCGDLYNEAVVADLNKVSLKEAWTCDAVKQVRSYFLNKNIPSNLFFYNCIYNTNNPVKPISDWV